MDSSLWKFRVVTFEWENCNMEPSDNCSGNYFIDLAENWSKRL